jgi:hypothetical protein
VIGNKPFSIDNKKYSYYSETDTTEPEKSEEEQLYEGIFIYGLINIFLLLILLIFNTVLCFMNIMIFIYLDLNYEENEINNFNYNNNIITVNNINTINYINSRNDINDTKTNNQNSINIINNKTDIIKKTTINFRGKIIIVQIKPNKNIYLLDNNSKEVHIFKEILMEGITKNFIYIRIKDEIIQDMLSTTDWEFPKVDQMFILIKNSFNYIFVEICFLPLSLYFQASKEHMYYQIKDNIKTNVISNIENVNIFNYYGNFEKGVTESRFILYFIALIILFIFMIKRFLYGGKRYSCLDIISLILSIMLNLMNIIYLVLTIILIVYAFRSSSVVDDYKKKCEEIFDSEIDASNLENVFIFQLLTSFFFLADFYKVLKSSLVLFIYLQKIKCSNDNSNENQTENNGLNLFNYVGLDNTTHTLYEYQISGHPRYLYYTFQKEINNEVNKDNGDKKDIQLLEIKKQKKDNEEIINSINMLNNEKHSQKTE